MKSLCCLIKAKYPWIFLIPYSASLHVCWGWLCYLCRWLFAQCPHTCSVAVLLVGAVLSVITVDLMPARLGVGHHQYLSVQSELGMYGPVDSISICWVYMVESTCSKPTGTIMLLHPCSASMGLALLFYFKAGALFFTSHVIRTTL